MEQIVLLNLCDPARTYLSLFSECIVTSDNITAVLILINSINLYSWFMQRRIHLIANFFLFDLFSFFLCIFFFLPRTESMHQQNCQFKSQMLAKLKTLWWRKYTKNRRHMESRVGKLWPFIKTLLWTSLFLGYIVIVPWLILIFVIMYPFLLDISVHLLFYRWKGTF